MNITLKKSNRLIKPNKMGTQRLNTYKHLAYLDILRDIECDV